MEKDKIFGISQDEMKRQLAMRRGYDTDPGFKRPINSEFNMLDVCISGGKKILEDPKKKQMFQRIYRR